MGLDEDEDTIFSESYFWSCLTLNHDCPFFSSLDPNLHYFGYGVAAFYVAFLLIALSDLGFNWTLDEMQKQMSYCINLVTRKVKIVQQDQKKLITTKERTKRLLQKSRDHTKMLTGLRSAVNTGDPRVLNIPAGLEGPSTSDQNTWSNIKNFGEM
ncbi:hypothetical protein NE865_15432 [Phthorimaea operculella]|nr:hypothetical protein NE865_15432 [Phthorimaea operculella]